MSGTELLKTEWLKIIRGSGQLSNMLKCINTLLQNEEGSERFADTGTRIFGEL